MLKGKETLVKNLFMLYMLQFANYIFPLITFPYLTRVLGPEKYGVVTYVYAVIIYLQIIVDFGFMLSATKDVVEYREDKNKLGEILGTVIILKLILAFICLILVSIITFNIGLLRSNIAFTYLSFVVVVLSILLPDYLFIGLEQMSILTIRFVLSKTVTILLVFVLIRTSDDILYIPILNILGTLIAVGLTWHEIIKKLQIRVIFNNINDCFVALKESSVYFISSVATTAFGALNTIVIGIYLPPTQVAYWGISYVLISTAQSLYTPLTTSFYPYMIANKDFGFIKRIIISFMIPIVMATAVTFVYAEPIIKLLCGLEYIEAIPVFRALTPVLVFSFPVMMIGFPLLGAMGKVKETSLSTVYSSVFHVGGLFFLIIFNRLNIINVAILRSLTEFIFLIIRLFWVLKYKNSKV